MSCSMRSLAAMFAGCALLPVTCLAQLSFQPHQAAQIASGSNVVAHGDFNNDGREDLVVINIGSSGATDQLYLSNGDGTYEAPKPLPGLVQAIGDFNHDGKLDIATASASSATVTVYLGNGDGTFQPGKSFTGPNEFIQSLLAVDLNHDSKTDLVEVLVPPATPQSTTLQLWISNGDGTFSKGQTIVASTGSVAHLDSSGAVTGDFDGDGKPDIAILYGYTLDSAKATTVPVPTTVQVWYGDGAGHLGSPYLFSDPNKYFDSIPIAADLNDDGRSDILAVPSKVSSSSTEVPALSIFTGNSNRTLSYKTLSTSECAGQEAEGLTVADFNGDGLNDIAYDQSPCAPSTSVNTEVIVRLGTGSGKFGPEQMVYQNLYQINEPYAVRTTHGTKPDIAFAQFNGGSNSAVSVLTNTSIGNFPGCGLSSMAEGVQICSPSATSAKFSVAAAGPTPMRTAAVWIDGRKAAEQLTHAFSNYSFLDAFIPLAAGNHTVTVFGTGWDNTLQKKSFTLTVGNSVCLPPASPGVHVCAPASGSTVTSPVRIQAAATITGKLARMEVWVDGTKRYTETTSTTLNTTLSMATGTHRFAIIAVNTTGTKWEQVIYATVK